jgi:hypothetical protein
MKVDLRASGCHLNGQTGAFRMSRTFFSVFRKSRLSRAEGEDRLRLLFKNKLFHAIIHQRCRVCHDSVSANFYLKTKNWEFYYKGTMLKMCIGTIIRG